MRPAARMSVLTLALMASAAIHSPMAEALCVGGPGGSCIGSGGSGGGDGYGGYVYQLFDGNAGGGGGDLFNAGEGGSSSSLSSMYNDYYDVISTGSSSYLAIFGGGSAPASGGDACTAGGGGGGSSSGSSSGSSDILSSGSSYYPNGGGDSFLTSTYAGTSTSYSDPYSNYNNNYSGGSYNCSSNTFMNDTYAGGSYNSPSNTFMNDTYAGGMGVGDPINSATGNKYAIQPDYVGRGPFPLRFVRVYNSQSNVSGIPATELGAGWRGTYDRSVEMVSGQSAPTARVVRADGKSFLFTLANGVWTPTANVTARLAGLYDASGDQIGWTYTTPQDGVETYDASGRLLAIANRAGLKQTLTYDAAGDLVTVTDPFGRQLNFRYNAAHELIGMTDPSGAVYAYGYDGNGNLVSVTYPDGTTRGYLYENASFPHALTGMVDADGVRFATWTYDSQGRAVSSSLAGGVDEVTLAYNGDGTTSVTNPLGATETRSFVDAFGTMEPAGVTVTCPGCTAMTSLITYDAEGFIASRTDFDGNTTTFTYDDLGLLTSRTDASGTPQARTVTFTWDTALRRPTEIRFPDHVVDFTYDAEGHVLTKTVSGGADTRTWQYQYNDLGLLTEIIGPRTGVSEITRLTYDAEGNLASVTNPLGQVWRYTAYDPDGRLLSLTDPNGVVTQFTYDAVGRLIRRTRAGRTTAYAYTPVGELSTITLPNGETRTFHYDAAHRLIGVTDALGDKLQFALDAAGDRTQTELLDPQGAVIREVSNTFDPLGRLVERTNADQATTDFSYDPDGRLLTVTNALGRVTSVAYDALGRRVRVTDPLGGVTALSYDSGNHVAQVVTPNGATTNFQYDGLGELLSETSPDRGTTTLTYDSAGLVATRTDARGVKATFHYDALNRLTAIL